MALKAIENIAGGMKTAWPVKAKIGESGGRSGVNCSWLDIYRSAAATG